PSATTCDRYLSPPPLCAQGSRRSRARAQRATLDSPEHKATLEHRREEASLIPDPRSLILVLPAAKPRARANRDWYVHQPPHRHLPPPFCAQGLSRAKPAKPGAGAASDP